MAVGCAAILGNVWGGTLRSGPSTDIAWVPHVGESSLWNSESYNAANNQHICTLKILVNENTSLCFPIQPTHFLLSHPISISSFSLLRGASILFNTFHPSTSKLFSNWIEHVARKQTGQPGASPPCSRSLGTVPILTAWATALLPSCCCSVAANSPTAVAAGRGYSTSQWERRAVSTNDCPFFFPILHFLNGKTITWTCTFSPNGIIQQLINFLWPLHTHKKKSPSHSSWISYLSLLIFCFAPEYQQWFPYIYNYKAVWKGLDQSYV